PRTYILTISLHDALPILRSHPRSCLGVQFRARSPINPRDPSRSVRSRYLRQVPVHKVSKRLILMDGNTNLEVLQDFDHKGCTRLDRKSTRLNSSHLVISY